MKWFLLALGSMTCFSAMLLVFKHLTRQGVAASIILVFTLGLALMFNLLHIGWRGDSMRIGARTWAWLALAAGLSYVGNLLFIRSIGVAPNPGYPTAVEGAKALLVMMASIWIFGSHLTILGGIGVGFCLAGLVLLAL
jgi:uncharacterized membrane protein